MPNTSNLMTKPNFNTVVTYLAAKDSITIDLDFSTTIKKRQLIIIKKQQQMIN